MAMGRRTRDEAERAIACCQPFRNSTGSFYGTRGGTTELGWLRSNPEHVKIKARLRDAIYTVWSYGTPIGCVTEDEDGNITKWYFDESHSATTSNHQSILRVAFSDFETIGEGPWSRSRQQTTRRPRGVRYGENYERRSQTPDPFLEARARVARDRLPETSYTPSHVEDSARARLAALLDPRYANPNWTPFDDGFNGSLPEGAEIRDEERVWAETRQAERRDGWRPAHP